MAEKTSIEWTDATWNPVRGCAAVSPGCLNCYAARTALRHGGPGRPYDGLAKKNASGLPIWSGEVRTVPDKLGEPLGWREPRRVFVNSMSDLFHAGVPFEFIDRVFAVIATTPRHTYQILTKRAGRMAEYFRDRATFSDVATRVVAEHDALPANERAPRWLHFFQGNYRLGEAWSMGEGGVAEPTEASWRIPRAWPLPNVWLGVSVENQECADRRIPELLKVPAAVRFLSVEPMLGPVDLSAWINATWYAEAETVTMRSGATGEILGSRPGRTGWHHVSAGRYGIGWVIVGGESGPGARPMHPEWARSMRDQCRAAGVPFFFKQNGEWLSVYDRDADPDARNLPDMEPDSRRWLNLSGGHGFHGDRVLAVQRIGKKAAGRLLDGREWNEFPAPVAAEAR